MWYLIFSLPWSFPLMSTMVWIISCLQRPVKAKMTVRRRSPHLPTLPDSHCARPKETGRPWRSKTPSMSTNCTNHQVVNIQAFFCPLCQKLRAEENWDFGQTQEKIGRNSGFRPFYRKIYTSKDFWKTQNFVWKTPGFSVKNSDFRLFLCWV